MRVRVLVYGSLAVLLAGVFSVLILQERESVAWRRAFSRLWSRGGEVIRFSACQARRDLAGETEEDRTAFPRWDDWPDQWRQDVESTGLRVLGTDVTGGLTVTTFVSDNSPGVRWFYIVPTKDGSGEPWFGFLAVSGDYYAHLRYPERWMPKIEKAGAEKRSPADLIRTLFGN